MYIHVCNIAKQNHSRTNKRCFTGCHPWVTLDFLYRQMCSNISVEVKLEVYRLGRDLELILAPLGLAPLPVGDLGLPLAAMPAGLTFGPVGD